MASRTCCCGRSFRRHPKAFTLTEMLVVISLIVLLMAMALPAFRFLTGSKSVEGATNVISAALAGSRTEAVGVQRTRGVVLFKEASSGRTVIALVEKKVFLPWLDGTDANPVSHSKGEYVSSGGNYYVCIQTHTDTTAGNIAVSNPAYWRQLSQTDVNDALANGVTLLDLIPDRDRSALTAGVDAYGAGNSRTVASETYAFFAPAVILFDSNGCLSVESYRLLQQSEIVATMDGTRMPPSTGRIDEVSQIGLMLVDEETSKNAMAALSGTQASQWIADNGTPLLVNRYNGTIVKGE